MKKLILFVTILSGSFLFQAANAQLRVSFRANIGVQPVWGPVGYSHVEYYYMPDIDVFYYVPQRQYVFQQGGRWTFSNSLPARYSNYDMYTGYKVVINDRAPYRNAAMYRQKYGRYKGNHGQQVIRDSRESKYYENPGHPEHNKWEQEHGRKKRRN